MIEKINKWLYRQSTEYKNNKQKIISAQIKLVQLISQKYANAKNKEGIEDELAINSICPKCKGNKIVDKIANVNGEGNINGSFSMFGGYISGRSSMQTDGVNHCNLCGNQWKKYLYSYTGSGVFIKNILKYIHRAKDKDSYSLQYEEILELKNVGILFETIEELNKEYNYGDSIGLSEYHGFKKYNLKYDL